MALTLYSYWRSSSAFRVRLVLHAKRLPFEYVPVNIAPDAGPDARSGYERVNPLRQVPTLTWTRDGERVVLTQSVAIAEYLEEHAPDERLLPADSLSRARVRELVEIVNSDIQPLQNASVLTRVRRAQGDAAAEAWARDAIELGLHALERHASEHAGRFAVGDAFTLADAFLVPQLYNARRYGVALTRFPTLVRIDAAVAELEAYARAHPDAQPDAPRAVHDGARHEGGSR